MKQITRYIAEDSTSFGSKQECSEYETLCERVKKIMSQLSEPPLDENCQFANGYGYIQHNPVVFRKVRNELLDEFSTKIDHKWITQSKSDGAHPSWVGRLVSDYNIKAYYTAWHRIQCTDKDFREFGQVYYAEHPNEAELFNVFEGVSNEN